MFKMFENIKRSFRNRSGLFYQWFYISLGAFSATLLIVLYYSSASHIQWKQLLKPRGISEEQKIAFLANRHPNLPIHYWMKIRTYSWLFHYENISCAMFPNLLEINLNQNYWQGLYTPDATIQLYSAYYDTREVTPGRSIRVLAMIDKNNIYFKLYCHIWYEDDKKPVLVEVNRTSYIQPPYWKVQANGKMGPYLLECTIPETRDKTPPIAVSIVASPCDRANNLLKVIYEPAIESENFAVCAKGLDFLHVDMSRRLVEWLELVFLFGANKVFFYELGIHPNMRKVIHYYHRLGKVDLRSLSLPEGQSNIPILQHYYLVTNSDQQMLDELVPYNDCFYRNIYSFKHVVHLSIYELIVPLKDDHWTDLLDRTKFTREDKHTYASYNAKSVYFIDDMTPPSEINTDIPQAMYMSQHAYRSKTISKPKTDVRSFFDTKYVLTCHNTLPIEYSNNSLLSYDIPEQLALAHIHRSRCPKNLESEEFMTDVVKDESISRFKAELLEKVQMVLRDLGLDDTEDIIDPINMIDE